MSAFAKGFIAGLSQIYAGASATKNLLYDAGFLDHCKLKTPVFSVGNLTMGGTGKTPICLWLAEEVLKRNKKPCVVARGYGSSLSYPREVDLAKENPVSLYGDEAVQMKMALPDCKVVVGNPKWQAAMWAEQQFAPDLIILDDGFQHRTLFRDFDLVLIDASQPTIALEPLPLGRAREGLSSLMRADLVVLTKVNSSSEALVQAYESKIPEQKKRHLEYLCSIEGLSDSRTYILASGIGNFAALRREVVKIIGETKLKESFEFRDHHLFTSLDAKKLLNSMVNHNANNILVTQKDFVKLSAFPELKETLAIVQLQIRWREYPKEIYEFFDSHNI